MKTTEKKKRKPIGSNKKLIVFKRDEHTCGNMPTGGVGVKLEVDCTSYLCQKVVQMKYRNFKLFVSIVIEAKEIMRI